MRALFVLATLDTHMVGHSRGSIDPWHSEGGECKPKWDTSEEELGHPLEFMARLLRDWPTGAPTVDLLPEERHLRFIQIVAGYPEIGRGMYPLDWPTHPMSVKAFRLSLFLDSLQVPNEHIEGASSIKAHSVRSAILALDAHAYDQIQNLSEIEYQIKRVQKECFTLLFRSLRVWSGDTEDDAEYQFNKEESVFMTSLHSSDNKGFSAWWLKKWIPDIKLERDNVKSYDLANVHTFKFDKIQTWIKKWTQYEAERIPLKENIRHNLHIGASVMLESLFAILRRHIITKYRPGSIKIDGGGRIEFYTPNPNAKKELLKAVNNSFTGVGPQNSHPFNIIIIKTLTEFGDGRICQNNQCRECEEPVGEEKKKNKDCHCGSKFPKWEWKEDNTPKKLAFRRFLKMNDIATKFYPTIKYNHGIEAEQWAKDVNCPLCNPPKHETSDVNIGDVEGVSIGEIEGICFLHLLTYRIGESHKRRDLSIRTKGEANHSGTKIHSVAMIDVNALGILFNAKLPKSVEEEMLSLDARPNRTEDDIDKIKDLMRSEKVDVFNTRKTNYEDVGMSKEEKLIFNNIKAQIQVFKERKSFRFNSKWWQCVSQICDHDSNLMGEIGAWIAAGDDLLFVRRGGKGEKSDTLKKRLIEFDEQLKLEFDESHPSVSFCAGIATRLPKEKIPKTIRLAFENEKKSKDNWKSRAKDSGRPDLISELNENGKTELKVFQNRTEWKQTDGPIHLMDRELAEEGSMIYQSITVREEE